MVKVEDRFEDIPQDYIKTEVLKEFVDPAIGGNSKPEDFNIRYHVRLKEIVQKKEEEPKEKGKKTNKGEEE